MKYFFTIYITFLLFSGTHAQSGVLKIDISGIDTRKGGELRTAVYDKQNYVNMDIQIAYKVIKVKNEFAKVIFDDVEEGVYAVAVFQDIDKDRLLGKNMFGLPNEPYGFSNNIYGKGGPPSFDDISFKLEAGKSIIIKINLN